MLGIFFLMTFLQKKIKMVGVTVVNALCFYNRISQDKFYFKFWSREKILLFRNTNSTFFLNSVYTEFEFDNNFTGKTFSYDLFTEKIKMVVGTVVYALCFHNCIRQGNLTSNFGTGKNVII